MQDIVIEPQGSCDGAVFWLHGLGADQNDLRPVAEALGCYRHTRNIFLQAPTKPVTINAGSSMPAWFDIHADDLRLSAQMNDEAGLQASVARIAALIQQQCRAGLARERIAVVGFSQGGAIALALALACRDALGAVASLSGWLVRNPLPRFATDQDGADQPEEIAPGRAPQSCTPLLLHHGREDDVVPAQSSAIASRRLHALGFEPEHQEFASGHGICAEQLPLIDRFLAGSLDLGLA